MENVNEDILGKEIVDEFFDYLDTIINKDNEWTADDQLNADICEATDGQQCLSHTG